MYGERLDDGNSIPGNDVSHGKSSIFGAIKAILSNFTVLRVKTSDEDTRAMNENLWLVPIVAGSLIAIAACAAHIIMDSGGVRSDFMIAGIIVMCFFGFAAFSSIGGVVRFFTNPEKGENAATDGIGIGVGISLISIFFMFGILTHTMYIMGLFLAALAVAPLVAGVTADAVGRSGKVSVNGRGLMMITVSSVASIIISLVLTRITCLTVEIPSSIEDLLIGAVALTAISVIVGFLTAFLAAKLGKGGMDSVRTANVFALIVAILLLVPIYKAIGMMM